MHNPIRNWRRQRKIRKFRSLKGTVETWTTICTAPADFAQETPYTVVLVRLDDGGYQYGILPDVPADQVSKGMRVRSVVRVVSPGKTGEDVITYGLKFVAVGKE